MRELSRGILMVALLVAAAMPTVQAQAVEFSADMKLQSGNGDTQIVQLYLGKQRMLIQRNESKSDAGGIGSIIIDFDHQFISLVVPQSKLYLRVSGSLGSPFSYAAWMFRPQNTAKPCDGWVAEADRRGMTLRCQAAGQEVIDTRTTQRWDAQATNGASGSLWYDPELNFIVKVARKSSKGVVSGYELQNVKKGTQPPAMFETTAYREFTIPKLLDALTGVGQW